MTNYIRENLSLLEVTGLDSKRYLNSRLTNNIRTLEEFQWIRAAMISPQGKAQALFDVLAFDNNVFKLICPTPKCTGIYNAVKQFIVSEQVDVRDLSNDFFRIKIFAKKYSQYGSTELQRIQNINGVVSYNSNSNVSAELNLIVHNSQTDEIVSKLTISGLTEMSEDEYLSYRIRSNQVYFERELSSESLLAKITLDSLVSFKKGCYIGQEVIEKLTTRGKSPTKIVSLMFATDKQIQANDLLMNNKNQSVGKILNCVKETDSIYSFGEVKTDAAEGDIFCNGQLATLIA